MEYIELIMELMPCILSIVATITAFKKGKTTMTKDEIETKAEKIKQKMIKKLEKKNHIPSKVETVVIETTENTNENVVEIL